MEDLTNIKSVKKILEDHSFVPLKSWGQNFLIDKEKVEKIIKAANLSKRDTVIEVGPGIGTLTLPLAESAGKVITIEKDKKLIPLLEKTLKGKRNIQLINEDILSFCIKTKQYKVVANVPYYITSPIIRKFLEQENLPSLLVLTVQKEVAERIIAKEPRMNLLAVSVRFFANPEIIENISPSSFYPPPSVKSSILRITPHDKKQQFSKKFRDKFFLIVRTGFSHPRKQLSKNFSFLDNRDTKGIELGLESITQAAKQLDINLQRRAETLSVEEWIELVKKIV